MTTRVSILGRLGEKLAKWVEPELFQPFIFSVLFCLTLSEFVNGALAYSVIPTYGRTVLKFEVEFSTLALSVQSLVSNVFRSPVGMLIDRFGQRIMLVVGFALSTGSVLLMMNVRSVVGLLISAALFGLSMTPVWPAAISAIGIATPEAKRASFMGYMYIFWLAGTGAGPVLINFVIGRTFHLAFWILFGVEAFALVFAFLMTRHAHDKAKRKEKRRHDYWHTVLQNVKDVVFLFPGMFAQTFAVASLMPILSLYARVVVKISPALLSTVLIVGGGFTVALLLPAGKLVDKFGPKRFLIPAFLIAGSGLAVYPMYHTLWMTYACVSLLGICYAFILPSWNAVLDKSIDADKKATLWGVFMTVEGAGTALGPYLGGLVWDKVNPSAPFWVSAGLILVMGFLYIFIPLDSARRRVAARKMSQVR